MTEIKELRERFGGADHKSINRHATRTYHFENGGWFRLDRTLDANPRFFTLTELSGDPRPGTPTIISFPPVVKVDGKEHWGDGLTWGQAEKLAKQTILQNSTRIY